jgi:hypothetical protein
VHKIKGSGLVFFLLILLYPLLGFKPELSNRYPVDPIYWVISKQCSLKVNGSTNINKFSCTILEYVQPDTLTISKLSKLQRIKMTGSIMLNVQNFDCKNAMMTNDLRKTLKAKQYPKLKITFEDLSEYPDPNNLKAKITGRVTIHLAGVMKQYDIDYHYKFSADHNICLIGNKELSFSDFDIVPPKRLGGMIKTNNSLNVEFILNLKVLP